MEASYQGNIKQAATQAEIIEYNPTYKHFNLIKREHTEYNGFVRREIRIKISPLQIARDPAALAFADLLIEAADLIKIEVERRGIEK